MNVVSTISLATGVEWIIRHRPRKREDARNTKGKKAFTAQAD